MAGLTIDELVSLRRLVSSVDISRWTGEHGTPRVYLRELSSEEMAARFQAKDDYATESAYEIAYSLCDSEGNRLINTDNAQELAAAVEKIRAFPFAMVQTIVEEIKRINNPTLGESFEQDVEGIAKN